MGEGIESVIGTYLSDTPTQLAALETAITQRDYEVLGRGAHSVKSSSQSLGRGGAGAYSGGIGNGRPWERTHRGGGAARRRDACGVQGRGVGDSAKWAPRPPCVFPTPLASMSG